MRRSHTAIVRLRRTRVRRWCTPLGQRIRTLHTGDLSVGEHSRVWNGHDDFGGESPPGIYFVRVTQGDVTESRRLVLVR